MFNIEESNAAWHRSRARGIGGSEIAILLDISPFKTQYQLWSEKMGLTQAEDISMLPHVQRGVQGEKIARIKFEQEKLCNYKPKRWATEGSPIMATDDGYNPETNTLLEIKCLGAKTHELVKEQGHIPEYYLCQCHYNMMVSGARLCYFISYYPETDDMVVVEVPRDEVICEEYKGIVQRWWQEHIIGRVPPTLTSKDKVVLKDEASVDLVTRYLNLVASRDEIDVLVKTLQQELYGLVSDARPSVRVGSVMVTKSTRKGAVDYNKVPALRDVNLDEYRKEPITTTSIRVVKDKA